MKYLSVCDGIGAAHVAWKPLGWECVGASEIEKFPIAVVRHRHPEIAHLGDMTKYHDWNIQAPDLVCGGTPCQAFSLAGLRAGLADPRGNLALVFLGIVDRYRPRWVVWENVPGVYSSTSHEAPDPKRPLFPVDLGCEGHEVDEADTYDAAEEHAFACFLAGLQELGYGCFWRTLDAQYCGVAQRRRRCFLVGYLGDWRPAAAVLFEPESMSGDPAPSREKGQGTSAEIAPSLTGSGRGVARTGESRGQDPVIAHALRGEGFDASEDGTGMGTPIVPVVFDPAQVTSVANRSNPQPGDPCHTLHAGEAPLLAHAFKFRGGGNSTGERGGNTGATGGTGYLGQDELAFTLSTDQDQHILQRYAVRRLTPRECERLMSFPDDYTLIPWSGKPAEECPDGPRYKALGNSWVVNEVIKIGRKIQLVEEIAREVSSRIDTEAA